MSPTPVLANTLGISSSFSVYKYSKEALYEALDKPALEASTDLREDRARFFHKYLGDLGTKTILVELEYVDGDYLDDYAAYYVKCFKRYPRRCKRLHFFSDDFTTADFLNVLDSTSTERAQVIQESYQGFIVLRPLPDAAIGRTVLKTYDSDNGRRQFPCILRYQSNLFGIDLSINTLPYQEQDAVLAACATVSLWSCFNKTRELFGSTSPTPAEITRAATSVISFSRSTPSSGLNVQQICSAVKHVGLEPEVIPVTSKTPLVSLIYGYVRKGLPVILGVDIQSRGPHAMAVVGYSLVEERQREAVLGVPMVGLRIDRLYTHDDQIGPFSRVWIQPSDNADYPCTLRGSWRDKAGNPLTMYPRVVIIPIYHKIRVTFSNVHKWTVPLHAVFQTMVGKEVNLEWDIFLTSTNEYKRDLREYEFVSKELLPQLLLHQYPRFMWRLILRSNNTELVEFLIDATDIASSIPFYQAIWFDEQLRIKLAELLDNPTMQESLVTMLRHRLLRTIKETVKAGLVILPE